MKRLALILGLLSPIAQAEPCQKIAEAYDAEMRLAKMKGPSVEQFNTDDGSTGAAFVFVNQEQTAMAALIFANKPNALEFKENVEVLERGECVGPGNKTFFYTKIYMSIPVQTTDSVKRAGRFETSSTEPRPGLNDAVRIK